MSKILVAGSSVIIRSVLKEVILKSRRLECVYESASYESMVASCEKLKPDVIISDKAIFDADRNSTLSEYCRFVRYPSIIFYSKDDKPIYNSNLVKFFELPDFINFTAQKIEEFASFLEQQILDLKRSELFEKHPTSIAAINEDGTVTQSLQELPQDFSDRHFKAVVVGVSTGGPGAVLDFLKGIGNGFPLPVIITQHIDSFFDKNLINWLASESGVPVHLAENNIRPLAGHVYFAPSDYHVTFVPYMQGSASGIVSDDFHLVLNHDEPVNFLRPSVSKMFESAAKVLGKNCIAVVLTGMGADGAKECLQLKQLGAYTITQDKDSSVIYGMPKAAFELGGSCEVLPLKQIPERLWSLIGVEKGGRA